MFSVRLTRVGIATLFGSILVAPNGCWEWQGDLNQGYGQATLERGISGGVHRIVYAWIFGPIPNGHKWHVDHIVCNNRKCCNPVHLKLVTARANTLRGNGITAQEARRTHCNYGHPFAGDNLKIRTDGARQCRACKRLNKAA